jgi:hypothetical protein
LGGAGPSSINTHFLMTVIGTGLSRKYVISVFF